VKAELVAVQLPERGLVLWMTRQIRDQFFKGVDRDAADAHNAPMPEEEET
jgi:hypothetical protein